MVRKSGRANVLRRIEELESRSTDASRLVPHSPAWLAFWQRQVHLYETGQEHAPLTLEGVRAVMHATPDAALGDHAEEDLILAGDHGGLVGRGSGLLDADVLPNARARRRAAAAQTARQAP
jgi:hypothetical protein